MAVVDARPESIESFDEGTPIDVGFKLPVEHARGTTYLFTFQCFADLLVNIGYDLVFAEVSVV